MSISKIPARTLRTSATISPTTIPAGNTPVRIGELTLGIGRYLLCAGLEWRETQGNNMIINNNTAGVNLVSDRSLTPHVAYPIDITTPSQILLYAYHGSDTAVEILREYFVAIKLP